MFLTQKSSVVFQEPILLFVINTGNVYHILTYSANQSLRDHLGRSYAQDRIEHAQTQQRKHSQKAVPLASEWHLLKARYVRATEVSECTLVPNLFSEKQREPQHKVGYSDRPARN